MLAHDGHQRHRRQGQEALLKRTQQRRRPLHQIGHLVQQGWVVGDDAANGARQLVGAGSDGLAARRRVQHDAGVVDGGAIVGRVAHLIGRRAIGAQAVGDAPARHSGVIERHDGRAVERQKPTQRPAVADVARVPAHRLLELKSGDEIG